MLWKGACKNTSRPGPNGPLGSYGSVSGHWSFARFWKLPCLFNPCDKTDRTKTRVCVTGMLVLLGHVKPRFLFSLGRGEVQPDHGILKKKHRWHASNAPIFWENSMSWGGCDASRWQYIINQRHPSGRFPVTTAVLFITIHQRQNVSKPHTRAAVGRTQKSWKQRWC